MPAINIEEVELRSKCLARQLAMERLRKFGSCMEQEINREGRPRGREEVLKRYKAAYPVCNERLKRGEL